MKPHRYTLEAAGQRIELLATSFDQVLHWAEARHPFLLDGEVRITRLQQLVDLTTQPAPVVTHLNMVPDASPQVKQAVGELVQAAYHHKPAKPQAASPSSAPQLTIAEAAERLGVNTKFILNAKYRGALQGGKGLVDLTSLQAYQARPADAGGRKKKTLATPVVPAGMVLVATLAKEAGLTTAGMRYRLRQAGIPIQRMAGTGQPMVVPEGPGRACLQAPAKAPKPAKPARATKAKATKPAPPPAPPAPSGPVADKMLHEDKAAQQLGLTVAQLREVKRNGNVPGGNGWVNITKLQAYMASAEYEPPFTTA